METYQAYQGVKNYNNCKQWTLCKLMHFHVTCTPPAEISQKLIRLNKSDIQKFLNIAENITFKCVPEVVCEVVLI